MKQALGIIETIGMVAAIDASDIAVKSANVTLIGVENSKGGGLMAVKIQGDVGAVKAAVDSVCGAQSMIGKIHAKTIIARPDNGIYELVLGKPKTVAASKPAISADNQNAPKNITAAPVEVKYSQVENKKPAVATVAPVTNTNSTASSTTNSANVAASSTKTTAGNSAKVATPTATQAKYKSKSPLPELVGKKIEKKK